MVGNFKDDVKLILELEGGYVNDPNDPGGETKYGISKKAYPNIDIKNLTVEEAELIYKRDFWDKTKCGVLPGGINTLVFDTAVNMGIDDAGVILQTAYNNTASLLNSNSNKLVEDGNIGDATIKAVSTFTTPAIFDALVYNFALLRIKKYVEIVKARPADIEFLANWIDRVFKVLKYMGIIVA